MIEWSLKTKKIADLSEHPKNPRQLSEREFKQLQKSIAKFGMIDKPIINRDGTIIGGHQRLKVLEEMGYTEVEVWIPDIDLTDEQVDQLNIRLNKNTGDWDWDILANEWDADDLLDWGFSEHELFVTKEEEEAEEASEKEEEGKKKPNLCDKCKQEIN